MLWEQRVVRCIRSRGGIALAGSALGGLQRIDFPVALTVGGFVMGGHVAGAYAPFDGRIGKYQAVLAYNAKNNNVPAVQIIDLQYQKFNVLKNNYNTLLQNIRMIDIHQKNRWSRQAKKWSIAALGMNKKGNMLFIHCGFPYTVYDFINILLKLPLDIYNCMYLEGGYQASFYLKTEII